MKRKKMCAHTHTQSNQQKAAAATVYAVNITHATRVNSLLSSNFQHTHQTYPMRAQKKLNILRNLKEKQKKTIKPIIMSSVHCTCMMRAERAHTH